MSTNNFLRVPAHLQTYGVYIDALCIIEYLGRQPDFFKLKIKQILWVDSIDIYINNTKMQYFKISSIFVYFIAL